MKLYTNTNISSFFLHKTFFFILNPNGFLVINKKSFNQVEFLEKQNNSLFSLSKLNDLFCLFFFKLILHGIGLRMWSFFEISKKKQILIFKLGFSKDILIVVPKSINVFVIRNNLLIIKSLSKLEGSSFACYIKKQRLSNRFKLKGVYFYKENPVLSMVKKKK